MDKRLLDSLWNHYWVNTLSSSLLITNSEYTTGMTPIDSFISRDDISNVLP